MAQWAKSLLCCANQVQISITHKKARGSDLELSFLGARGERRGIEEQSPASHWKSA